MSQPEQQGLISSLAKHGLSWSNPAQPRCHMPLNSHHGPGPGFSLGPWVTEAQPGDPQTHYYIAEPRG